MTNPNEPAFPSESEADNSLASALAYRGLTKREWFAGKAMEGIIASARTSIANPSFYQVSLNAITQADSLIAALNKPQGDK